MTLSDILLLISLAVVVLWTAWLARTKGLNPWLWGIGAALLVVVAWNFGRQYVGLALMAPLLFLLLFRSPLFRKNRAAPGEPCPRCAAPDTGGLNFCVQCGWDLSKPYASTGEAEEPAAAAPEPTPETAPLASTSETAPETAFETPVESAAPAAPEPVFAPAAETELAISREAAAAEPVFAPAAGAESTAEPAPPAAAAIPGAAAPRPSSTRRVPTAASMTEQGIALFGQGRFQEAIDQFTKAIALDPKYRLAWERRAEAYGRLGRAEREAADKRQLEAI